MMPTLEVPTVLCPIAIAASCRKCPIVGVCPAKGIIGDYKPDEPAKKAPSAGSGKHASKKQR